MNEIKKINLTKNITFHEYMEGTLPTLAYNLNWKSFNNLNDTQKEEFINKAKQVAIEVQKERDYINEHFKHENNNKEFTVLITSGFRCKEWELHQGRSGASQHTIAAIDFVIMNCSLELSAKIHKDIFDRRNKSWLGGFAIKYPTTSKGKLTTSGFIHIDCRQPDTYQIQRGYGARWIY